MSEPLQIESGPAAPTQETPGAAPPPPAALPVDLSTQPSQGQPGPAPADPTQQRRGLIIGGLILINVLCVLAIAAVVTRSKHGDAAAAAQPQPEATSSAAAAEPKEPEREAPAPSAADDAKKPTEPTARAASSAAAEASEGGTHAVVTVPPGHSRAYMRLRPEPGAPTVAMLPAGTSVEITKKVMVKTTPWYRVKTVNFQPAASGWMHGNVLKME